jgi:hypothetical protein
VALGQVMTELLDNSEDIEAGVTETAVPGRRGSNSSQGIQDNTKGGGRRDGKAQCRGDQSYCT